MLTLDGAEHARHREPFARAVPARRGARALHRRVVAEETDRLLDALAPRGRGRAAARRWRGRSPRAIVTFALGLEDAGDRRGRCGWYDAIVASVTEITAGRPLTGAGPRRRSPRCAQRSSRARARPGASLVAAAAGEAGGLARDEVVSNAAVLLFGGIETTEGMIANALVAPARAPGRSSRGARPTAACCANAIEESLRLEPAAAVDRPLRDARRVELGGAAIAARRARRRLDRRRQPRPGGVPGPRPLRRAPRRTRGCHIAFAARPARLPRHAPRAAGGAHRGGAGARAPARPAARPGLRRAPRGLVFRKPRAVAARWRT